MQSFRWARVQDEADLKQALRSSKPQAVLSDFSMPGFDGIQALRVVREMTPGVPFIFVSGTIGEERAIDAIRLGATDYVLKNNMRRLGTAVKRALSESAEREHIRLAEEERARLVKVLEATSDYVGISDPTGKIIYMNAAGRKLAGARGLRGAAAAFRQLRFAHQPAEPHSAWRPYRSGHRAHPSQRPPGGSAGAQPGPVQARQRELQPRSGRRAAGKRCRPAAGGRA